ncbi:MAG: peptide chain release factor N(5)-glutamine methyltransferase, partial [Desulfosarcinaceae bacterium]
KVNPDVLIPRPETECLVETAINRMKSMASGSLPVILELGTGSGAISIAMAHDFPKARYFASDLSEAAARLARENAEQQIGSGHIAFFAGRWLDAVRKPSHGFDVIVSNPPYIRDADIEQLAREIRDFEPRQALSGGPDGLHEIRCLINAASAFLKPGGCLIIEIGYDQKAAVESLAAKYGHYHPASFSKDYGGHDRVAVLEKGEI